MRLIALLAAAAALSGCTTLNRQAIDTGALGTLKDQTITHTTRKKPDFTAMTADKAMFGMLGASPMVSQGNSIIAANKVADPADAVALGLVNVLEQAHGVRLVGPPVATDTDDAARIAEATAARFVVDAQTTSWGLFYFPTDWSHYRVMHVLKVRLIDTHAKRVVAEGFCRRMPDHSPKAPTYGQLVGSQAAGLKRELGVAAEECLKSLKSEMLLL